MTVTLRPGDCPQCFGYGVEEGSDSARCESCDGTGKDRGRKIEDIKTMCPQVLEPRGKT